MVPAFAELVRITVVGSDGQTVLDEASVAFRAGTWTALVGHSGGGKTTILRLLLGIIHPSSGQVRVDGIDLAKATYRQMRQHRLRTGYVFEATGLWANRTIYENIALPFAYHARRATDDEVTSARVHAVAEELGIGGSLHFLSYVADASVRKRTLVARALMLEPSLLLCDEPQVGLVAKEAQLVNEAFKRRRASRQMTVVFADHDGELDPFEVDQRWHIEEGRVLERPSVVPPLDRRVDVRDTITALGEASAMGPRP